MILKKELLRRIEQLEYCTNMPRNTRFGTEKIPINMVINAILDYLDLDIHYEAAKSSRYTVNKRS